MDCHITASAEYGVWYIRLWGKCYNWRWALIRKLVHKKLLCCKCLFRLYWLTLTGTPYLSENLCTVSFGNMGSSITLKFILVLVECGLFGLFNLARRFTFFGLKSVSSIRSLSCSDSLWSVSATETWLAAYLPRLPNMWNSPGLSDVGVLELFFLLFGFEPVGRGALAAP